MTPPVFAHGHLRLYILSILASHPSHGYELIQALGALFGGTYIPSAGTIYPRLAKLEEDGLVSKSTNGRKTIYEITDTGRAELKFRQGELEKIETDVSNSVRHLADGVRASVDDALKTLRADLASAARDARERQAPQSNSPRESNSLMLRQAEALLTEFRHQLRVDVRIMAARNSIPDDFIPNLRTRLKQVRREITRP